MHWYHTIEVIELQTPSRNVGIDFETEARYRKEGARFIMELGNKLGLKYLTMATGIVFFHRFYMYHSFKEFSRWVTGATCLFLAGKVEETPKKCRDILKFAQQSLSDHHFKTFGENPREEVMIFERILLQTIKFDLQTSHPYQYLLKYAKGLKGEKSKINELVQKAWIFINDSLSTTLCLVYTPQVVALAVILLAVKLSNQNIRDFMLKPHADWWRPLYAEAEEKDLEAICEELMNMYEGKPPKRRYPNNHLEKIKESDKSQSNSPVPPGSPQTKKQKVSVSKSTTISSTATALTTSTVLTTAATSTTLSSIKTNTTRVVSSSTNKTAELKVPVKPKKVEKPPSSESSVDTPVKVPATTPSQTSQQQLSVQQPEAHQQPSTQQQSSVQPQQLPSTQQQQQQQQSSVQQKKQSTIKQQQQSSAQQQPMVQTPQRQQSAVQRVQPEQPAQIQQPQIQHHQQHQQLGQGNVQQQQIQQTSAVSLVPTQSLVTSQQSFQQPAPILDHMSSFFQSNQSYNAFQPFSQRQNFTPPQFHQQQQQQNLPQCVPQPTLPQGLPQPPQFATNTFSQQNYINMTHDPQRNPYADQVSVNQQAYNYGTLQPPILMHQSTMGGQPQQLPPAYHNAPWLQ